MYFVVFQTTERIVSFYVIVKRSCTIQHLDVTLCDDKFMFNQIFIKQHVWITNLHVIIVCLYKIIIQFIFPALKLNIRVVKVFFFFLVSPMSTIVIPTTTKDVRSTANTLPIFIYGMIILLKFLIPFFHEMFSRTVRSVIVFLENIWLISEN